MRLVLDQGVRRDAALRLPSLGYSCTHLGNRDEPGNRSGNPGLLVFREAWDRVKQLPLADQDIVLTVPASFDEEARELTVMAAVEAGLPRLTLLEEPAACAGIRAILGREHG